MPRRGNVPKREILPDPMYNSVLVTKLINGGDHCSNVAVALIELEHDVFDTHEYLDSLKIIHDAAFSENYEQFRARFSIENI